MKRLLIVFILLFIASIGFAQWHTHVVTPMSGTQSWIGMNVAGAGQAADKTVLFPLTLNGQMIPQDKLGEYSFYAVAYYEMGMNGMIFMASYESVGTFQIDNVEADGNCSGTDATPIGKSEISASLDILTGAFSGYSLTLYMSDFKSIGTMSLTGIELYVVHNADASNYSATTGYLEWETIKGLDELSLDIIDPTVPGPSTGPSLDVTDIIAGCWVSGGTFDLTKGIGNVSAGAMVKYYSDANGANEITAPAAVAMPATNATQDITCYAKAVDADGESELKPIKVSVRATPDVTLTIDKTNPVCYDTEVTFTANKQNTFIDGTYTFSSAGSTWTSGAQAGQTYKKRITATDKVQVEVITSVATGQCRGTAEINVQVTPAIASGDILITASKEPICSGEQITLTASVSKAELAGTTFEWQAPVIAADKNKATIQVTPLVSTSYEVKGILNGCSSSTAQSKNIVVNPTPTLTITNPPAVCGGTVDLTMPGVTAGSTSGLAYTYYTDPACTSVVADATKVNDGTYYIKGITTKGCGASGAVTAKVNTLPVPAIAVENGITADCSGKQVKLTASPDGMKTYSWSNASTGKETTVTLADGSNSYTVTVTDYNNCSATVAAPVVITGRKLPTVSIDPVLDACAGSSINLVATPTYYDGAVQANVAWTGATVADASALSTTATLAPKDNKYTMTVTDNKGCSGKSDITVKGNVLTVTASASPGGTVSANTTVTLTATAIWNDVATNAVTYDWKKILPLPEETLGSLKTETVTPTGSSIYEVRVAKDGCGDTSTINIDVQLDPFVVGDITGGKAICENADLSGAGKMTLAVSAIGGQPSYTYQWTVPTGVTVAATDGATLEITGIDYTQVANGSEISVTVSDANTPIVNTVTQKYYMNITPLPVIQINGSDAGATIQACQNVTKNLTASVKGVLSGVSFVWKTAGGETTATIPANVSATGSTVYTVTGTHNECSADGSVTVEVNALPDLALAIQVAGTDVTSACPGVDITLTATSVAVTDPLKYSWSNAANSVTGITGTVKTPVSGSPKYTVSVTDGTCSNKQEKTLTIFSPGNLSIAGDNSVCAGSGVTLTASGGSEYAWAGTDGSTSSENPYIATPANSTIYTVNGKDANGCKANSANKTITVLAAPKLELSKTELAACAGTSIDLKSAKNDVTSTSGAVLWIYKDGQTMADATTSTVLSNADDAGTYHLFLKPSSGSCTSPEKTVTVKFNPLPDITVEIADSKINPCSGEVVTLQAKSTDATQPTFAYNGTNGTSWTITPSNNGASDQVVTYNVTATNSNSCTKTGKIDVTVKPLPNIQIDGPTTVCKGSEVTLVAKGGKDDNSYQWNDAGLTNNKTLTVTPTVSNNVFTVTGTGANGCENKATQTLNLLEAPDITIGILAAACADVNVDLTGAVVTSGLTLTFYGSDKTTVLGSPIVSQSIAGTYTYYVKGTVAGNNCPSKLETISLTVKPKPVLSFTGASIICSGTPTDITVQGNDIKSYKWKDNGKSDNPRTFAPTVTTTYTVTGTGNNNCAADADIEITVNPKPEIVWNAVTNGITTAVEGTQVSVGVDRKVSTTEPYTYTWIHNGTEIVANANSSSCDVIAANNPETFEVSIKDGNGCISPVIRKDVAVTPQGGVLTVTLASSSDNICQGGMQLLTAKPLNGKPGYTYKWYKDNVEITGETAAVLAVVEAGVYKVEVADNGATKQTADATKTMAMDALHTAPQVTVTNMTILSGTSTVLFSEVQPSAGTYAYTWSKAGLADDSQASKVYPQTAVLTANQDYYLYVTDANGCISKSAKGTVTIDAGAFKVTAEVTPAATEICIGGRAWLNARITGVTVPLEEDLTYTWLPSDDLSGSALKNPVFRPSASGTKEYVVKVSDKNGHVAGASVSVSVNANRTPVLSLKDAKCDGDFVEVTATMATVNTYNWIIDGGATETTSNSTKLLAVGSHAVKVFATATNGCPSDTISKDYEINALPSIDWDVNNKWSADIGSSVTIKAIADNGAAGTYTYTWSSPGAGTKVENACTVNPLTGKTLFKVKVKNDITGCTSVDIDKNVEARTIKPKIEFNTNVDNSLLCVNGGSVLQVTSVWGGNGSTDVFTDYTYEWTKDGAVVGSDRTLVVTALGTYTIKVKDSEMRESDAKNIAVNFSANTAPQVANSSLTVANGSQAYLSGTVSGGVPTYNYQWSSVYGFASATNIPNPQTATFTSLGAKDYQYYVTDANNCTSAMATVTVHVVGAADPSLFTVIASADRDEICLGNTTTLRVKTSRTLVNPTYEWTPVEGLNNAKIANPIFTPTVGKTHAYTVKVTENGTVSATAQVKVKVPGNNTPILALTSEGDCAGEKIQVTNSGSTVANNGYSWYLNGTLLSGVQSESYALGEGQNQKIQVVAKGANTCVSDTVEGVFNRKPAPVLTWSTASGYNPVNVTINQFVNMKVVSSMSGASYHWSSVFTPKDGVAQAPVLGSDADEMQVYGTSEGSYKFTVYPSLDGCDGKAIEKTVNIIPEGAKLEVTTNGSEFEVCNGGSAIVTATATNGDGNFTYKWYKGTIVAGQPVAEGATVNLVPAVYGEKYIVEVTDGTGVKAECKPVTLKISGDEAPVVSNYVQSVVAGNSTVLLSDASGTFKPFDYHWTPVDLLAAGEDRKQNPTTVTLTNALPDYTYTYYVVDINGCNSAPATVKVIVATGSDALAIKATTDNATLCKNNVAHLKVEATHGTLSSSAKYEWTPNDGNLSALNVANPVFQAAAAGSYEYTVKVEDGGKTVAAKVKVEVRDFVAPTLAWDVDNNPTSYRKGQSLQVAAIANDGAAGTYTYQWLKPASSLNITGTYSIPSTTELEYDFWVYVKDANGCSNSDTLKLNIKAEEAQEIPIEINVENKGGCSVSGSDSYEMQLPVVLTAGPGKVDYEWTNKGNTLVITDANKATAKLNITNAVTPGTYTFQVKVSDPDHAANFKVGELTVTIWSLPTASWAASNPTTYPLNGSFSMNAQATGGLEPYTFHWTKPTAQTNTGTYTVNPAIASSYDFEVYVTDDNGCVSASTPLATVTGVTGIVPIEIEVSNQQACAMPAGSSETVNLTATLTSAHANVSYAWIQKTGENLTLTDANNSTAKVKLAGAAAGSYGFEVTVTDLDHPENKTTKPVTLIIEAAPQFQIDPHMLVLHRDSTFTLKIVKDIKNYSYIWTESVYDMSNSTWSNPVNKGITNSVSGVMVDQDIRYVLTATDALSTQKCKATDTALIYRIPNSPDLAIDTNTNRLNVKLSWGAVSMSDDYTVWNRKWDPYTMTNADGGKYAQENTQTATVWKESKMDTLEFYYVTANRTIDGVTYYSHTSDTVGYYLYNLDHNDGKSSSVWYPLYFDMTAKGIVTTEYFIAQNQGTLSSVAAWDYTQQVWGTATTYYNPKDDDPTSTDPVEYYDVFTLQYPSVIRLEVKKAGKILQYGNLPKPITFKIESGYTGASKYSMSFIQPYRIDLHESSDVISNLLGKISSLSTWYFQTQQVSTASTYYNPKDDDPTSTDPVEYYDIFKLKVLLPIRIENSANTDINWCK